VKMTIGAGFASLLIGMNAKMLKSFGDMAKPHRKLTVDNLQEKAGLSEEQARTVVRDVSALNGNEIRQLDSQSLAQTTDLTGFSSEQTSSLLSTLNSLNGDELVNSFYGWYWQGCFHYGSAVVLRTLGRAVLSGDIKNTPEFIQNELEPAKNGVLNKIFLLKEAVSGCPADTKVLKKALTAKFTGLQLFTQAWCSRSSAKQVCNDFWNLVSGSETVTELEANLAGYMNQEGLSRRERNQREEHFVALADLVEHYKFGSNKVADDTTTRIRIQDSTLNGLPLLSAMPSDSHQVPVLERAKALARLGAGSVLKWTVSTRKGEKMVRCARVQLTEIKIKEDEYRAQIAARTRLNYSTGNYNRAYSDTAIILKEKHRHNFLTVNLARASETFRFVGHHLIVSSDTNLGRSFGKGFELVTRMVTGSRATILNTRAAGKVVGVGTVGLALSAASWGWGPLADAGVSVGLGLLDNGGIPLGESGMRM
ncbi:MAG: hypothetical protein R3194_11920, partial [Limnobacter sp.]|nr:hypothetical protein [Limnobacter sp.]